MFGDALLIEAAIRLQAAVRKSDCVARLGGDEYAVLLTQNPAAADIEAGVQAYRRQLSPWRWSSMAPA